MKTLILVATLLIIPFAAQADSWCQERMKCDANGCRTIIDCR